MKEELRGIYGILVTPFNEKSEIDDDSLRREVAFCIQSKAHGMVWPVSSSEFQALSYDERIHGAELIAEELARMPEPERPGFVVGTAGVNTRDAVSLTQHAESIGADGVVAMPPFASNTLVHQIPEYYYRIAEATKLPVVIQNQTGPFGNVSSVEMIVGMAKNMPNISYVKEESGICTHMISALNEAGGDALKGVFGGSGGYHLVQEMIRGSCGMMSSCHLVDVQVKVWDLYHQGDMDGARAALLEIVPIQVLWLQLGMQVPKQVLQSRGIIRTTIVRSGKAVADDTDSKEVEAWLSRLKPMLNV